MYPNSDLFYLPADEVEGVGLYCECGEEACYDDGKYEGMCYQCADEAAYEMYIDRLAEDLLDREMFPEDYDMDYYGEEY